MGSVNINNTGGGADVTLSSDGTSLLLNGTAVGGSPELYAENPVTPTAPSATGDNAVAIGSAAIAGGNQSVALGAANSSGVQSFSAQINNTDTAYGATGANSISIGKSSQATGTQAIAIGKEARSLGYASIAIGDGSLGNANWSVATGYNAKSYGDKSHALTNSYASGADSFAAAIANNTSSYGATGTNSVAIGSQAKASGSYAVALGRQSISSGDNTIAIGYTSNVSGYYGTAIGYGATSSGGFVTGGNVSIGTFSNATQVGSIALGYRAYSNLKGKLAVTNNTFTNSPDGSAQFGLMVLKQQTSTATPAIMVTENNASTMNSPSTTNQIVLLNNSAYAFHGTIVARQQASLGTACAAWKIEGLIRREGSAGTTVLINSATTVLDNTPAWGMTLSADTTNGGLAITVTGASTNIRWVATINTSEVTY